MYSVHEKHSASNFYEIDPWKRLLVAWKSGWQLLSKIYKQIKEEQSAPEIQTNKNIRMRDYYNKSVTLKYPYEFSYVADLSSIFIQQLTTLA